MGAEPTQALKEIAETRERLDGELRELQRRLPAPARWAKRAAGLAAGGGAGATAFWFVVRRVRKRKKAKDQQQQIQADVNLLPGQWATKLTEAIQDARWRQGAAVAFGGWALFRLAELRQLRRMNRALLMRQGLATA